MVAVKKNTSFTIFNPDHAYKQRASRQQPYGWYTTTILMQLIQLFSTTPTLNRVHWCKLYNNNNFIGNNYKLNNPCRPSTMKLRIHSNSRLFQNSIFILFIFEKNRNGTKIFNLYIVQIKIVDKIFTFFIYVKRLLAWRSYRLSFFMQNMEKSFEWNGE